ncbi:Cfr10I/Bse634I family restriction endonuclease [Roseomonas sp. SSH11]|uniref:Cfr10I/Bse634I family restriction endonuclease n=1 Tax=Pararoseomonas baculiformis TaxID=2820812 RepID=A0ABS4AK71_9PROT|nr:Cfr10I/Bse634I family restriction endonuclease [Pararoseomonas baculiformis]MBP0447434.1 Cfr10I/Bse634I family restriction endonuclease [Pararoseomonas baculiformis]
MARIFPAAPDPGAQVTVCATCHAAGTGCILDVRVNRIRNRNTNFRLNQDRLVDCAFRSYVPGCDGDPDPTRPFAAYRAQAIANLHAAGAINFPAQGTDPGYGFNSINAQALGKVQGDVYEILEAAALWNAAADWNTFMDSGTWPAGPFAQPVGAVPTPLRRVAIVKLPRNYDSTRLLTPASRAAYKAFQQSLERQGMVLRLSSPDIVGVRIPEPMPSSYDRFLQRLPDLSMASYRQLQGAHQAIEGTLDGRNFLFAIAVKTSTRSDRLYQPLFEANVLKFIIGFVLRGSSLRFHVHMEDFEGADVEGAYRAASLPSLLLGGTPQKAVDKLYQAITPRATAQEILDEMPLFPL